MVQGLGRNVYFDGLKKFGYFIELLERHQKNFDTSIRMYEFHLNWDGTDPVRPYNL